MQLDYEPIPCSNHDSHRPHVWTHPKYGNTEYLGVDMQRDKEEFVRMTDARAILTDITNKARHGSVPTVLTSNGKPQAVVVNYDWYIKMMYGEDQ